ncbi:iron ABC transporter permease [Egibacter rhizosphaerae]|uniref:Iron ABC transporter permease n=1 Tax=Egibacter rhizosphaerae TaxID=1670831 RepID=A0A411YB81_9ACTN|nr:iron chelate uptake ABC transporter family permease subunit [Egibacter rhizosphaerae]QBI18449.1 iron ABC transporter permease [Egibacter rhizosphaerae]
MPELLPRPHTRGATGSRSQRVTVRLPAVALSTRISPRTVGAGIVAFALVMATTVAALLLGEVELGPGGALSALAGAEETPEAEAFVVRALRLPRALAAVLVGGALAASGAIFQGLVRNPLVAPDVIGVNAGAGVLAVLTIVTAQAVVWLPVAALAGAVGTAFAIYGLTWRRGISGHRLVLVGIGVNAALTALTTLLIVRFPVERVSSAVRWQTGTLHGTGWDEVALVGVGVAVLLPLGVWLTRQLGALELGDDAARALGARVEPARAGLLGVGAGLAAVAVAASGPIGFVALATPHLARWLAGPLTRGVLVLSALLGGGLVGLSDLAAQHALPTSLPVGVVTAAAGAPYFLLLLYRTNRAAL